MNNSTELAAAVTGNQPSDAMTDFAFKTFPRLVVPIIFGVVTVIGFVGNAMVILVFFMFRAMRDTTNTLIVNLAVADLLFVTFCVPFTAVQYATSVWPFPDFWCKIVSYVQQVSAHASVWLLFCLAADRFLAVVYPFVAIRFRCMRTALITCSVVWICVLVINTPLLTIYSVLTYRYNDSANNITEERRMCLYLRKASQTEQTWVIYMLNFGHALLGFVVPLGITVILYIWMIRRLWYNPFGKYANNANSDDKRPSRLSTPRRASNDNIRAKKRITLMVLAVTIVFGVCWLPQIIRAYIIDAMSYVYDDRPLAMRESIYRPGVAAFLLQILMQVMGYANSCLNPILYGVLSENYKKGFINFFHMIRGQKPKHKIRRLTRPLLEELSRPAIMCALHAASDRRKNVQQNESLIEQTADDQPNHLFHDADDEDKEVAAHEVLVMHDLVGEGEERYTDSEQHLVEDSVNPDHKHLEQYELNVADI